MSMRGAEIVVAAILMGFGILVAVDSVRRGAGWGPDGPQAGFFPFMMAVLILAGCAVVLWQAIRRTGVAESGARFVVRGGLRPVLTVLVPAALMVALTEVVGLYLASMIYLTAYIRWVGGFRWVVVLAVGILVPLVFYVMFEKFFLVPMPQGILGRTLGF